MAITEKQNGAVYLTREMAAEYLGVDPSTIYRWARDGRLVYFRLGDGKRGLLRFRRSDLDDFMGQNRVPTLDERKAALS